MNNEKRRRALELMRKYYGGIVESESKIVPPELETVSISGTILNFNTDISRPLENLILHLEPTQSGSGDPSPSNIRPITGYDSLSVKRAGKNLLNHSDITLNKTTNRTSGFFCDNPPGTFSTSVVVTRNTTTKNVTIGLRDKSGSGYVTFSQISIPAGKIGKFTTTYTTNKPTTYVYCFINTSDVDNAEIEISDFQIELGSTATDYEPYQGRTYEVTFPSEAGTVYGGSLNVTSGELTVDRAYALLNDPDLWNTRSGTVDFFYDKLYSDRKKYKDSYNGLICSYMVVKSSSPNTARWIGAATDLFGLKWTGGTLEQVKADAQDNKIAIVYELANPITFQLTPTEVTTLLGDNTIWMDAEGTIDSKYWRIKQ